MPLPISISLFLKIYDYLKIDLSIFLQMENGVPTFAMVSMLKNLCGYMNTKNLVLKRQLATVMVVCVVQY